MRDDTLQITCFCGCGNGYIFRYLDGNYYIDLVEGYFSSRAMTFCNRIQEKYRLMNERWLGDCMLYEDDIKNMIEFLGRPCNHDKVDNSSFLTVSKEYEKDEHNETMYAMMMMCTMPKYMILIGKAYRCGEIVLNESERVKLVKKLKHALKMKAREM